MRTVSLCMIAGYSLLAILSWTASGLVELILVGIVLAGLTVLAGLALLITTKAETLPPEYLRWARAAAIGTVLIGIFAQPLLTGDLRFYIAESRWFAAGGDGYSESIPSSIAQTIHLGPAYRNMLMTYGPLWSYGAAMVSRAHFNEWIALKLLFAVSWLGTLWMVDQLVASRGDKARIISLIVLGWMPISAFQVMEAHNDSVMVGLVTCWMYLRSQRSPYSGVPLVLSVLIKYVTAPLLFVAAFDAIRHRRFRELTVLTFATAAGAIWMSVMWNHGQMFEVLLREMGNWKFLSIAFVLQWLGAKAHQPGLAQAVTLLVRAVLGFGLITYIFNWYKSGDERSSVTLAAAGMSVLLLGNSSIWPWYVLWALPLLLVAADPYLWRVWLPLMVGLPLAQLFWAGMAQRWPHRSAAVVALYFLVMGGWIFGRRVSESMVRV